MLKKLSVLAAMVAFAVPGSSVAQVPGIGLEIEPYLGVYVPLADLVDDEFEEVVAGQKEGLAIGGRVHLSLLGPLGIEGNLMYAFSDVTLEEAGSVADTSANVFAVDARLALRLGVPAFPLSFHVNGGIAYVSHGGDAFDDVEEGDSNVGGVVGVGMQVKLPGAFGIRGDAEAYLYKAELQADIAGVPQTFESQFQADLVFSVGVVIGLL